ncbi:hypothetical protein KF913_09370 [Candidatus Obscuribacterales bacterium]|nr:hypothetical protein [Candidatus Obscuribacterales bacterium]
MRLKIAKKLGIENEGPTFTTTRKIKISKSTSTPITISADKEEERDHAQQS